NAFVDGAWRGHITEAQIRRHGGAIDAASKGRVGTQRLELRAEEERAVDPGVVEGLLAKTVTGNDEMLTHAIPQRECEHAPQARDGCFCAPTRNRCQDHLRVRRATEGHAVGFQLYP